MYRIDMGFSVDPLECIVTLLRKFYNIPSMEAGIEKFKEIVDIVYGYKRDVMSDDTLDRYREMTLE